MADSTLRLTRVLLAGLDLRLTYTLIYQANLWTYSVKCIIFMVFFLPPDFSYHWFRLWLLLQEPWRSFKTLAATDSSCSGWFELWRQVRDLRPINYLQNFDPGCRRCAVKFVEFDTKAKVQIKAEASTRPNKPLQQPPDWRRKGLYFTDWLLHHCY